MPPRDDPHPPLPPHPADPHPPEDEQEPQAISISRRVVQNRCGVHTHRNPCGSTDRHTRAYVSRLWVRGSGGAFCASGGWGSTRWGGAPACLWRRKNGKRRLPPYPVLPDQQTSGSESLQAGALPDELTSCATGDPVLRAGRTGGHRRCRASLLEGLRRGRRG